MNQNERNQEPLVSNRNFGQHEEETSPLAVAAGSFIAAAMDSADAFLEILMQERARRQEQGKEQSRPSTPTNEEQTEANSQLETRQEVGIDEDSIPIVTVKTNAPNSATAAHDLFDEDDDNTVEVRVSSQAPRARKTEPRRQRARELASALLDIFVEQVGDYIEHSPAVSRVIRTQVDNVLNEFAAHPEKLQPLIQAQAAAYLSYLQLHPEVVEPFIRQQAGLYLDQLRQQSAQVDSLVEKIAGN